MVGSRQDGGPICGIRSQNSCRWADVSESESDAAEDTAALPAAPTIDDSYRDAPVASLEDSCGALNSGVRAVGLDAGPKDFAFLLQDPVVAPQHSEASGELAGTPNPKSRAADLDRPTPHPVWRLNADAPEFIPTLTAVPLIGFCPVLPEDMGTPEKGADPLTWLLRGSPRHRGTRKRRSSGFQVPAKRTKSEEKQAAPIPGRQEMPPASEDDWQHRQEVRQRAIDVGKNTREYQWYAEHRQQQQEEEHVEGAPMTPDATDRSVSKRRWKYDVYQWRLALKQRYLEEGRGSIASAEDCQSVLTTMTEEAASIPVGELECDA